MIEMIEEVISVKILMVEDNPGDVRLVQEALKDAGARDELLTVYDGQQAIAFLRKQGKYASVSRPDLVLLDLNLPKKDGREVLAEIKADQDLRRIPVVVLTSSKSENDVLRCYDLHANCYIPKPLDLEDFMAMVRAVEEFWTTRVKLPPN